MLCEGPEHRACFKGVLRQLADAISHGYSYESEDELKAKGIHELAQDLILHHFGPGSLYYAGGGGGWAWRPRGALREYSRTFLEPPSTDFDPAGHALEAARARVRVATAFTLAVMFDGVFPCDVIQTIHYCVFWT